MMAAMGATSCATSRMSVNRSCTACERFTPCAPPLPVEAVREQRPCAMTPALPGAALLRVGVMRRGVRLLPDVCPA
jgi:hypothetical protein